MESWLEHAIRNNAEWCDVICRSHGLRPRFDDVAWTSSSRTPRYYPDAITLVPDLSVPDLLARIDASEGCSVKDSFASIALHAHGFHALFDAQWIVSPDTQGLPPAVGPDWELVRDRADFASWVDAWSGDDDPADVLRAEMLDHDSVAVLVERSGDRVVAGAIAMHSASVVGISNFFAVDGITAGAWSGCLEFVRSLYPHSTVVGYESGDDLVAAERAGFQRMGPLRIWMRGD